MSTIFDVRNVRLPRLNRSTVIIGSLVSVLPMLILFPFLQKYVARGLTLGAVAGE